MDWFLMVTTLFTNASLGWFKGVWWIWLIHAFNAVLWIYYSIVIQQWGFVGLSIVTILIDLVSSYRNWRKEKIN